MVEWVATPGNKMTGNAAYKVNIPLYEGPLDLLLDLIKKQEMNIHDIQISLITAQYLEYLHKLEELNVDVSADFIYMAATLIYIKSKMLLPPDPLGAEEGPEGDPRAELVQRLVEHEKFKNAAQLLYQKQQVEENVWSKPDKSLYNDEGTEGELVVSLVDLVKGVSAGFGAAQGSFADRSAARAVYRGADDCGVAGAITGERGRAWFRT